MRLSWSVLLAPATAGALLAGPACVPAAQAQATYTITSISPAQVAAGSGGFQATATVTSSDGNSPLNLCFYTGYGNTAPVHPTSVTASGINQFNVTFPVLGSSVQQVPPSAFGGPATAPYFTATVSVAPANATSCTTGGSGTATVTINYPTLTTLSLTSAPDQNPNLTSRLPRSLELLGANFLAPASAPDASSSATASTVTITGGAATANGSVRFITSEALVSSLPATLPAGNPSLSVTACNQAVYTYCAAPQQISLQALAADPGTLSITPNPPAEDQPATLLADFGPPTPSAQYGAPGGIVTFSAGDISYPAPLILDTTAQLLQQTGNSNTAVFTTTGAAPIALTADMNGDGIPDSIFLDPAAGIFHVLLGVPPYSVDQQVVPGGASCSAIPSAAIGDFNSDGVADIAYICQQGVSGTATYVMLGLGDGVTFSTPALVSSSSATLVAAADFNHDGILDLVLALPSSGTAQVSLAVYTGKGDGTFAAQDVSGPFPGTPAQLVATDLNGDGAADLVLLSTNSASPGILTFQNIKDGNASYGMFAAPLQPLNGNYSHVLAAPLVAAQISGTQCTSSCTLPSLIAVDTTNQQLVTAINTSTAATLSFSGAAQPTSVPGLTSAAAGDFNADGYSDLGVAGGGGVEVLTGDGTGSFTATAYPLLADGSADPSSIVIGAPDENGDGFADLLVLSTQGGSGSYTSTEHGYITAGTSHASLLNPFGFDGGSNTVTATTKGTYTIGGGSASVSFTVPSTLVWPAGDLSVTPASGAPYGTAPTVFTATVSGTGSVPTGYVYFFLNYQLAATVALSGTGQTATASFNAGLLQAGTYEMCAYYSGDSTYGRGEKMISYTVAQATPVVTWVPNPATIVPGTPLSSAQLDANASVPGTFVYTPALGAVLPAGPQTLSLTFTPNDAVDYSTVVKTTTINVANFVLGSLTPSSASLGDPDTTLVVAGSGFLPGAAVLVNGTAVPTIYTSSTSLQAVIAASNFLTVRTLQVTVQNPGQMLSGSLPFSVVAPAVAVIISGPTTTTIDLEPQITFQLLKPYPVDIVGSFTLSFAPAHNSPDDPTIRFESSGTNTTDTTGRTFGFVIPAHTTATPAVLFQSGSTAGAITLTLQLSAGGTNITPSTVQPLVIVDPDQVPGVTSVTLSASGQTLTVVTRGYSNTRELQHANFHFEAAPGKAISTQDLQIDEVSLFSNYYQSAISAEYGSTFTYTQTFNLDQPASVVGAVTVTLTNNVGSSAYGSSF